MIPRKHTDHLEQIALEDPLQHLESGNFDDYYDGVAARILLSVGDMSYKRISDLTGLNHETTRRYLHGHRMPAHVLAIYATKLGLDPMWILFGMQGIRAEVVAHIDKRLRETVDGAVEVIVNTLFSEAKAPRDGNKLRLAESANEYGSASRGPLSSVSDSLRSTTGVQPWARPQR